MTIIRTFRMLFSSTTRWKRSTTLLIVLLMVMWGGAASAAHPGDGGSSALASVTESGSGGVASAAENDSDAAAENDSADTNGTGATVVIGAPLHDNGTEENVGAASGYRNPEEGRVNLSTADTTFVGESEGVPWRIAPWVDEYETGDQAGSSVALGDLNGDGETDYVVGTPFDDEYGNNSGAAYVVYGPVEGRLTLSKADAKLYGEGPGARAGVAITVGDINADGVDDVVVGAPGTNNSSGKVGLREGPEGAGAAYVVYAPVSGEQNLSTADAILRGRPVQTVEGDDQGDLSFTEEHAGTALDVGDVNGDEYADVIVGVPSRSDANLEPDITGAVDVVYGPSNGTVDLKSQADESFESSGDTGTVGWAVAAIGDIGGNASGDYAAGNPGAGYVLERDPIYGDPIDVLEIGGAYFITTEGAVPVLILGEGKDDQFGASIAHAGDVNADGRPDVVVGAPGNDTSGQEAGAAYLLYDVPIENRSSNWSSKLFHVNNSTVESAKLVGQSAGDLAGVSVAGVGDVNSDGYDDVLIGAPGANRAYLVSGPINGTVPLANATTVFVGQQPGDSAGAAVTGTC